MKRLFFAFSLIAALAFAQGCHNRPGEGKGGDSDSTSVDSDSVAVAAQPLVIPDEPVLDIVTSMGTIKVKLYSKTPHHRDNFVKLAQSKFYDGVLFHRVIKGFMIQAGDPWTKDTSKVSVWGEGGPGYTIPAEFVKEYYHKKGALAAARMGDLANPKKASSGSQFYIVQDENACLHLDDQYTVFGETIEGLDVVDRIAVVPTDPYDHPIRPVTILSIRLESGSQMAAEPEAEASEPAPSDPEPSAEAAESSKSAEPAAEPSAKPAAEPVKEVKEAPALEVKTAKEAKPAVVRDGEKSARKAIKKFDE